MTTRSQAPAAAGTGRERIAQAAYDLFSREGTQTVGIDSIIARAGAAKMTLYRNFPSKDALILDFLSRREQLWTRDWLQAEAEHRADTPQGVLLAIFDVFGEWFASPDFDGCAFITAVIEYQDTPGAVRDASVLHLANIRSLPRRARGCRRRRRPRCLRPAVAHPDEGLDRRRARGRRRGRRPGQGAGRPAPAQPRHQRRRLTGHDPRVLPNPPPAHRSRRTRRQRHLAPLRRRRADLRGGRDPGRAHRRPARRRGRPPGRPRRRHGPQHPALSARLARSRQPRRDQRPDQSRERPRRAGRPDPAGQAPRAGQRRRARGGDRPGRRTRRPAARRPRRDGPGRGLGRARAGRAPAARPRSRPTTSRSCCPPRVRPGAPSWSCRPTVRTRWRAKASRTGWSSTPRTA